ncbi:DUF4381 family protein [Methylopila henanensis]|uniref:DUF4381 family protein n=1 Tax=Methylopila henanensis TaxID=873516 RepID=A0ABW4K4Z3_9HYPH
MPPADELQGLRGLHLPPAAGSYWTDIGLAVALGLVLALCAALLFQLLARPRLSLRASAVTAFKDTLALPEDEKRVAQAALLRRIVRTIAGEEDARRVGGEWAKTLDRVFGSDLFTARGGRVFADGLYVREAGDTAALDDELGALMRRLER